MRLESIGERIKEAITNKQTNAALNRTEPARMEQFRTCVKKDAIASLEEYIIKQAIPTGLPKISYSRFGKLTKLYIGTTQPSLQYT